TGGRGSQTGLYRVTYVGPHSPVEQPDITESQLREATKHRAVRRELEELHVEVAPQKISFIAEHLASSDRWIRFAARVALENQPVDQWKSLIEAATNEQTRLTASLALARVGGEDDQSLLWKQNAIADWEATNETDLLWRLRSLQVSAARTGLPNDTLQAAVGKKIEAIFPHPSGRVNRLASELLAVMKSSETIPELSNLLANATTQEEQIQYAKTLVNAKLPWSLDDRERFVAWLHASRRLPGGKLVDAAMANLRADFLGQLSDEERERLTESISKLDEPLPDEFSITGPPRKFVNNWTVDQLSAKLVGGEGQPGQKDAHDVGWNVLAAASCLRCHRLGERGGRIGPDLSAVGKRYDTRALLESIVEPSKVVDPKYLYSSYALTDGRVLTGRPVGVNRNEITIETNPLTGETEVIPRAEIEETKIANISPMPAGLLNTFTPEEIAALIALLKTSTE
ncbi:MAG: c-type cytochrome, partial [Planctomycetaceae bacterium]|nr:c-type cytochrome [Planctomycetaceae bacterium]